jgi:hypothetical protein
MTHLTAVAQMIPADSTLSSHQKARLMAEIADECGYDSVRSEARARIVEMRRLGSKTDALEMALEILADAHRVIAFRG